MKSKKYTYLLYFISLVILITIGIQFYWNHKNYEIGKQQLTNDVQASFNDAIDAYYIDKGKENTIGIFTNGKKAFNALDSIISLVVTNSNGISTRSLDTISLLKSGVTVVKGQKAKTYQQNKNLSDTIVKIRNLAANIIISLHTDTLDVQKLVPHIDEQLASKNIQIDYGFSFTNGEKEQEYHPAIIDSSVTKTISKSGYLPDDSQFNIYFTNASATILKRNFLGIVLSFMLVAAIVACLFWLLRIIKKQKQLAELKNDLISNITHEFKTPISTISVALEGMQNFNRDNDPKKTANYLETAAQHLRKLSLMVERLLETSSLDSDKLQLRKEKVEFVDVLKNMAEKYQQSNPKKDINFHAESAFIKVEADRFHIENALNNLIDNAVKYGGDKIEIDIEKRQNKLRIIIQDSGNQLTKEQSKHLFDKFYRVPKGNRHDVKGFGIGLYYTQKIIEKHDGKIDVDVTQNTKFIIEIPNA